MPPSIGHRFDDDSKYGMRDLMTEMEAGLLALNKFVSTVVEEPKEKTKLSASVDISIIAKIFAVPKNSSDGKDVNQQMEDLRESVAQFIAAKVIEIRGSGGDFSSLPNNTDILKMAHELLASPEESVVTESQVAKEPKQQQLVPKVIEFDADGKPITQHQTVSVTATIPTVETIPWSTWAEKKTATNANDRAKTIALMSVDWMHKSMTSQNVIPITLVRKARVIEAKATRELATKELVVPLFFSKHSSMQCQGDGGNVLHPNTACVEVSWTTATTADEREKGLEGEEITRVQVYVQPELKLPDKSKDGLAWKNDSAVHPYWFIPRSNGNDGEANADVVRQEVTVVLASSFKPLSSDAVKLSPGADTYTVAVPCIVNTKKIEAGKNVILKGQPISKKPKSKAAELNAFDQITQRESKRKKAKLGGAA